MAQGENPQVSIYIATINTAPATELCIRSLRAYTPREMYRLHICDSGSEDGSLPMLTRLSHAGVIDDLTVVPRGRAHGEWLDWWVSICPTRFGVALDSDIEILEDGWLEILIETACARATSLVTPEIMSEVPGYIDHTGVPRRLARRPAPWMMLFEPEQCRPLGSWQTVMDVDDTIPEGWWGLDTGAGIMRELEKRGLGAAEAPGPLKEKFRHYGGMSWVRALERSPGWRLKAKTAKVQALNLYVRWRIALVRYRAWRA